MRKDQGASLPALVLGVVVCWLLAGVIGLLVQVFGGGA